MLTYYLLLTFKHNALKSHCQASTDTKTVIVTGCNSKPFRQKIFQTQVPGYFLPVFVYKQKFINYLIYSQQDYY